MHAASAPAPTQPPPRRRRRGRIPALAPLGVLALAVGCTLLAALYVHRATREADERRFGELIEEVRQTVDQRLAAYVNVLYAARGQLQASGPLARDAFATFVGAMEIPERLPGVQGIGYCARMDAAARGEWTERLRGEGLPSFQIWPPLPPGLEDGCPIVLLEPMDWRNARALGFDMFTEPTRRTAMEQARDEDRPVASHKVVLVQETRENRQAGFNLYLPLYDTPHPATVAERRAHLLGFVYSPFRAGDLFRGLAPPSARGRIDFEIYDGDEPARDRLLFDDDGRLQGLEGSEGRLRRSVAIETAGVRWTAVFTTRPSFEEGSTRGLSVLVALGGGLISVLLYLIAQAQAAARLQAEEAEEHAALLAHAATQLGRSLDPAAVVLLGARLGATVCADLCDVLLVQAEGDVVWARAERGSSEAPHLQRLEGNSQRPVLDGLLQRGSAVELGPSESPFATLLAAPAPAGIAHALALPLQARGETFGAVVLLHRAPVLGHAQHGLCEELSRLIAGALDNARLYESAQEAVRVREEFLSIASHELKTPLTSLRLHMQSLRRSVRPDAPRPAPPERIQRAVETAERQTVRLTSLVDNLLDLSRLTSGHIQLEPEPLDLGQLVREVSTRLGPEAASAGCVVQVEAPSIEGSWDRLRLEQVVTNLLSNAIKYGPGKPVHVRVEALGERARIRVEDEGIGIAPEDVGRIFDRFERAVSARHYGGLGLGLYIVRQIVDALGGRIWVESTPGKGSAFTVELPLESARRAASEPPSPLH